MKFEIKKISQDEMSNLMTIELENFIISNNPKGESHIEIQFT
jgi:hypothetical protein